MLIVVVSVHDVDLMASRLAGVNKQRC